MRRTLGGICILLFACGLAACSDGISLLNDDVVGSGTIVTETRAVAEFDQITLAGEGAVIITEGPGASLTIETDDNLMAHIETTVRGGELRIATESGIDINPTNSVIYRVSTPEITELSLSGAGTLTLGQSEAESLTIKLSGAGGIEVASLIADRLSVEISGVGSITIAGAVGNQDVRLPGAGNYEAAELRSSIATVTTSGTGSATVWVTSELDAEVTGVGSIDYFGTPQVTESITGIGSITSRGDK